MTAYEKRFVHAELAALPTLPVPVAEMTEREFLIYRGLVIAVAALQFLVADDTEMPTGGRRALFEAFGLGKTI